MKKKLLYGGDGTARLFEEKAVSIFLRQAGNTIY